MTREEILAVAKPILFNTDMVLAVLDDRKTATRRKIDIDIINKCDMEVDGTLLNYQNEYGDFIDPVKLCRYQKGDYLYVRETWSEWTDGYVYRAWTSPFPQPGRYPNKMMKWHPSIHMPKEAARIFLRVTGVRVERLQDITESQAVKEGIIRYDDMSDMEYMDWTRRTGIYPKAKEEWGYKNYLWHGNFGMHGTGNKMSDAWKYQYSSYDSARDSFSSLWNTTISLKDWNVYGWSANPWVWVIEFERCEKPASMQDCSAAGI